MSRTQRTEPRSIGTVIGGAVGFFLGGPAGAQLGMAGSFPIGGLVDPSQIPGPAIVAETISTEGLQDNAARNALSRNHSWREA